MRTAVIALLTAALIPIGTAAHAAPTVTTAELHEAALQFCAAHPTLDSLRAAGYAPVKPGASHWALNGFQGAARFDPERPRQVVVHDGQLTGVLHAQSLRFGGLPDFGAPAHPHTHSGGRTSMLHIWCDSDIDIAFMQPNDFNRMRRGKPASDAGGHH